MACEEKQPAGESFKGTDLCFTCAQTGNLLSVTAFDVSTGAISKTYSCDSASRSATRSASTALTNLTVGKATSLCLLGRTYLLCASNSVPFIYAWNLKKERLQVKISCVGLVGALACSPEGTYCAAAIGEKIHIWEVCTGHLLAVVGQHYQPINVLRFTDDGVHLLSGGEDARVIVWSVSSVLSEAYTSSSFRIPNAPPLATPLMMHPPTTRHVWSDHSLPVTDIHCGSGGLQSRVATVSLDQTCKLYELCSGQLLCSFLFDFGLTRVTMDLAEHWLFVGGSNGDIAQINLFNRVDRHLKDNSSVGQDQEKKNKFKGHSKTITGLGVGRWNHLLVSTSQEDTARVWDIASHQCLRLVKLKGPVSCMFTTGSALPLNSSTGAHRDCSQHEVPPLQPFQKRLYYSSDSADAPGSRSQSDVVPIHLRGIDPLSDLSLLTRYESCFIPPMVSKEKESNAELSLHGVRQELSEVLDVHKKIYSFIMKQSCSD